MAGPLIVIEVVTLSSGIVGGSHVPQGVDGHAAHADLAERSR
jgi:hypothetical protein